MEWARWTERDGKLPKNPILVEGLPGIGHVGQLAAQHLVDTLGGKLVAELHSPDFPPQALVDPDGTARLIGLRLWAIPAVGKSPAIAVLTGDTQPMSPHGQFEITRVVLDRLQESGCTTLYTLGGVGTSGDTTHVIGAATDAETVTAMKAQGAHFDELGPDGGIIGASGVFLGMAGLRGMKGGCLMGESESGLVDADAAGRVLDVLCKLLGREVSHDGLEEGGQRIEEQLQMLDDIRYFAAPSDAEHHYIG